MVLSLILAAVSFAPTFTPGDPIPPPSLEVRFEQPGRLLQHVLDLFRGSSAPDPATALAQWKIATKGQGSLGKGAEAAVAALNPRMVSELAILDNATFALDFDAQTGRPVWSFSVPHDDGTVAAFATAIALTDGAGEGAQGAMQVDRLGKTGAPLMGRVGDAIVVGDSPSSLDRGLALMPRPSFARPLGGSIQAKLDVQVLANAKRIEARQIGQGLLALGNREATLDASVHDDQTTITARRLGTELEPNASLDPVWFARIPDDSSLAVVMAIDSRPRTWDRFFAALDRAEKAIPANQNRSPLRTRIGLVARLAGVDLESDVWPKLKGVTVFMTGTARKPTGVAMALHLGDKADSQLFLDRVLPRLAKSLKLDPPAKTEGQASARPLAQLSGQTVWMSQDGERTVWLGWGLASRPTEIDPEHRAKVLGGDPSVARTGWIRLDLLGVIAEKSPLSEAIAASGPLVWEGRDVPGESTDVLTWKQPSRAIRRFLEQIPQEPLPVSQK